MFYCQFLQFSGYPQTNLCGIVSSEGNYIPGTCNIGREQLAKRKLFLLKCVLVTLVCIIFLEVFHLDKTLRLFIFIPFTLTTIGTQQVLFKFCYIFGLKGYYGFGAVGKAKTVEEDAYRRLDLRKSQKMILSSVIIGLILAFVYYYLV